MNYIVTLDDLTFRVSKYVRDDITTTIRLGILESGIACVEAQVDIVDGIEFFSIAGITFDSGCTFGTIMKRGDNTRTMLNATILFIKHFYPHCEKITLQDESMFTCSENGKNIVLSNHNLLLYGKTWYQRYFKVKFNGRQVAKNILIEAKKRLNEKPDKLPFNTWHDYFKSLTCEEYCKVYEKISDKLNIPDLKGTTWVINRFPVMKIVIKEVKFNGELQRGGYYKRPTMFMGNFENL